MEQDSLRHQYLRSRYEKNRGIKLKPLANLQFEYHLSDHCNLNCAGCDHFSPLAEPRFQDYETAERDFTRLSSLFQGKCSYVRLLGGEPLLHPELTRFVTLSRSCFPEAIVSIVTNGLLLERMPPAFFETCRKERAEISITRYPISLEYDRILSVINSKGIKAYFNNPGQKTMYRNPLNLQGNSDPNDSFILCHRSNNCITLRDGRLYTCSLIPVIGILNRFFDLDFRVSKDDSVDIYSADTAEEVLMRLSEPSAFCSYCSPWKSEFGIPWGKSSYCMEEWVLCEDKTL